MTAWPSKTSISFVPEKTKSQSCSLRFEIHIAAVCIRQTIANYLVSGTDRIRCHSLSDNMWPQQDDVIKWKHFPRYWPFVRGTHRSPMISPHKGQWRGTLIFSLICAWINCWVNNREAGDLRSHRAHYDVTVMSSCFSYAMDRGIRCNWFRPLVSIEFENKTKTIDTQSTLYYLKTLLKCRCNNTIAWYGVRNCMHVKTYKHHFISMLC